MWGILIPLLIGIALGYFSPGRQDKSKLFLKGLIFSLVVAGVIVLIGRLTNTNPLGLGNTSFVGLAISFAISLAVMMVGVWIGDMLEHRKGGRNDVAARPPMRRV